MRNAKPMSMAWESRKASNCHDGICWSRCDVVLDVGFEFAILGLGVILTLNCEEDENKSMFSLTTKR